MSRREEASWSRFRLERRASFVSWGSEARVVAIMGMDFGVVLRRCLVMA